VQEVPVAGRDFDVALFEDGFEGIVEGAAGGVVAAIPIEGLGLHGGREFRKGVGGGAL
jgi:hypothetical protein